MDFYLPLNYFKLQKKKKNINVYILCGIRSVGLDLTSESMLSGKFSENDDVARRCKVFREIIRSYQESISAPEKVRNYHLILI